MKAAVRFYTRSGNTKKLANAIAEAAGTTAETVSVPLDTQVDVLFLGCSYYAFDVDESVKEFIRKNKDRIGKIVCFGTSAMMKSVYRPMKKVAEEHGVAIAKEDFHCRGSFGPLHKDRPNAEDLYLAKLFAEKVLD